MVATTEAVKRTELLFNGRKCRNCFEMEAARVHASQPPQLPRTYAAIRQAPGKSHAKQTRKEGQIEALLTQRWQKWCARVGRRYRSVEPRAEILAVLLGRMVWEIRLCGWDHTAAAFGLDRRTVLQWWASREVGDRYSMIVMGKGRDAPMRRMPLWMMLGIAPVSRR